jgi:putative oxidoreductase
MAWIVIVVHSLGGAMLVVGLWTRVAAAATAVIILGALVKVHLPQGFFLTVMKDGSVGGFEFVLLLLAASGALILTGGGALAITRDR